MIQELTTFIRQLALRFGLPDIDLPSHTSSQITEKDLTSDCLLVKSDNLLALSMMAEGLCNKVEFCYIDPPYNTGGKFVYHDKRNSSLHPLWGRHGEWMSFMLPRLVLARHVLSENGVMAISIDDYEYAQLKVLTDSIFTPECHIATLVVRRSNNGKGSKLNVSVNHEYVLLYGKSNTAKLRGLLEDDDSKYDKSDEYGSYRIDGLFRKKGDASLKEERPSMHYPLYCAADGRVYTEKVSADLQEVLPQDSLGVQRRWLWGREKATAESWKLFASKGGVVYVKNYNREDKRVKIKSILDKLEYLTERATNEAKEIFGERIFETPKPINLIQDLIDCCSSENAIILDFFAGTGTTAHAAYRLQGTSPTKRKTILVEHKHLIKTDHAASQGGFLTTADITEHRLKALQQNDTAYSYAVIDI
ncbi:MAG: site-specific DNA-methyltransferase [Burkholderiales bacterium]|nr:site-specific DNA-methyltransferase [Burkholderiales bacterium]